MTFTSDEETWFKVTTTPKTLLMLSVNPIGGAKEKEYRVWRRIFHRIGITLTFDPKT